MENVRIDEKGIKINIGGNKGGIDTRIFIDFEELLKGKEVSCGEVQWTFEKLSIWVTGDISKLPKRIEIQSNGKQFSKEVLEKGLTFVRKEKGVYKIKIFIPRNSFLSDEEAGRIKEQRKQKQKKGQQKNRPLNCFRKPTGKSGQTNYSHSNVGHPYKGGMCIPK